MKGTEYKTKEEVLKKAQEAIGIPFGIIDKTGRLATGKGAVGTVVEESWFHYSPNGDTEPDFPEAGVQLKVTPYIKSNTSIRAKERLVCNIINYMTEYRKTFETSDFWHKCKTMLIMSYEHRYDVPKSEYKIDKAILFSFPVQDLIIIQHDWETIIKKIRDGKAHLITEGDTLYLAACTKGANSSSVREQPFSSIPAKQRAYSLKPSYMTMVLNSYIFGNKTDENIIKDWHDLEHTTFERYILSRFEPYYGKSQDYFKDLYNITSECKNMNEVIVSKILGIQGRVSRTKQFIKANIIPKTIRVQKNGNIKQSMSFPTFRFTEIIQETWETSELRNYLEPAKFMFIIFKQDIHGIYRLDRVKFWNIPADDLREVQRVWERTVDVIRKGVELYRVGSVTYNNLPKQTESTVAHVRPHAKDGNDTYPLPDGRNMTKQCFWFNSSYIKKIIKE